MQAIFISIVLFFLTPIREESDVQLALQQVLNIEEFNQYISKSPRFVSSHEHQILLLAHDKINKEATFVINQIPIKIVESPTTIINEKLFFIHVIALEINQKTAKISLDYQNARLLLEENKKITLDANLKKTKGEWKIIDYEVSEISTSY
jgi:hypothetical protein